VGDFSKKIQLPKRSKKAAGNANVEIKEYEDDQVYIPSNSNCFAKCIKKIVSEKEGEGHTDSLVEDSYSRFVIDQKLRKGMVPMCKIAKFQDILESKGVYLNLCRYD